MNHFHCWLRNGNAIRSMKKVFLPNFFPYNFCVQINIPYSVEVKQKRNKKLGKRSWFLHTKSILHVICRFEYILRRKVLRLLLLDRCPCLTPMYRVQPSTIIYKQSREIQIQVFGRKPKNWSQMHTPQHVWNAQTHSVQRTQRSYLARCWR